MPWMMMMFRLFSIRNKSKKNEKDMCYVTRMPLTLTQPRDVCPLPNLNNASYKSCSLPVFFLLIFTTSIPTAVTSNTPLNTAIM